MNNNINKIEYFTHDKQEYVCRKRLKNDLWIHSVWEISSSLLDKQASARFEQPPVNVIRQRHMFHRWRLASRESTGCNFSTQHSQFCSYDRWALNHSTWAQWAENWPQLSGQWTSQKIKWSVSRAGGRRSGNSVVSGSIILSGNFADPAPST